MRNSIILITASVLIWPYLPSRKTGSASPSASPSSFSSVADDTQSPAITRWLAKNTPDAKVWTERNDKHLELTKEAAEERLLFQEAERPRVWRLRNTAAFEAGSPHSVPVGSQVDLSDLKIKPE
ncbi:hypothetical protein EHS25_003647 [Saitozyma podzolica]|uniref:Uncharacterized protein n=1 Tax=Saitozyma podzolica TaxID=1890683 RepID=A0A427Y7V5_9TREE|nr:hypothetical protein EHS25_003647 [Saitozyma podzolica]